VLLQYVVESVTVIGDCRRDMCIPFRGYENYIYTVFDIYGAGKGGMLRLNGW
jgi:hypothetical protein